MSVRITPSIPTRKTNLQRRPWLIKRGMTPRRQSELAFVPIQKSAMPEVQNDEDQCFHCGHFGHISLDCPDKKLPPTAEGYQHWRRYASGKMYSVFALWPSVAYQQAFDQALAEFPFAFASDSQTPPQPQL
ncbi:hypothetical protein DFH28DRAFT_884222 [Melampsora americana]|nr:hypothetical protein DFH28DRAFT_884222 [Melampsora americana]